MKLQIQDICFSYDSTPVLQDVTFPVNKGEVVGLVGPNGTGKSTLLKCMNKILKPATGVVLIDNKDIGRTSSIQLAKEIGYVPQVSNSYFAITVYEAVLLGRKPYIQWKESNYDKEVVWQVICDLNLEKMAFKNFTELSGGERQRVLIARALVQQPSVLLLDEPTNNLDLKYQLEVLTLLQKTVQVNNISVIMAIHDLNLAARYADKLVFIKEGRVYACGKPAKVLNKENIAAVYEVDVNIISSEFGLHIYPVSPIFQQESK